MKIKTVSLIPLIIALTGCSAMSEKECNEEFSLTPDYRLYHWTNDHSLPFPDTPTGEAFKKCLKVFQAEYDAINCEGHIRTMESTIDTQRRNPKVFPVEAKLYNMAIDVCTEDRLNEFNNKNREYLIQNSLL